MSDSVKPLNPASMKPGDEFWTVHGIDVATKEFRLIRYRLNDVRRHSGLIKCSQLEDDGQVRVENLTLVQSDVFVADTVGPVRGRFWGSREDAVRAMCDEFHKEFLAVRGKFTEVHEVFLAAREGAAKLGVRFGVPVPMTEAQFDDLVCAWHGRTAPSAEHEPLHEFLGLTVEQYNACVEGRARWAEEPKGVEIG